MNRIVVQYLYPDRYQKLLVGYMVSLLGWYSKNYESIVMDLVLIYKRRGFVKTSPATVSVAVN